MPGGGRRSAVRRRPRRIHRRRGDLVAQARASGDGAARAIASAAQADPGGVGRQPAGANRPGRRSPGSTALGDELRDADSALDGRTAAGTVPDPPRPDRRADPAGPGRRGSARPARRAAARGDRHAQRGPGRPAVAAELAAGPLVRVGRAGRFRLRSRRGPATMPPRLRGPPRTAPNLSGPNATSAPNGPARPPRPGRTRPSKAARTGTGGTRTCRTGRAERERAEREWHDALAAAERRSRGRRRPTDAQTCRTDGRGRRPRPRAATGRRPRRVSPARSAPPGRRPRRPAGRPPAVDRLRGRAGLTGSAVT